ncbi:MAG: S1C family serine protease [Armatimonadota bacterium]
MKRHGRASSAALAGFLGVVVGAALVWGVARRLPVSAAKPGAAPAAQTTTGPAVSVASEDAITAAVQKVGPAVANISVLFEPTRQDMMARAFGMQPSPRAGQGSGVIIDRQNGYILTNAHVVKGAQRVAVTLADGRQFEAHVVGMDPLTEVAVVKVSGDDLPQAELGSAESMPIGSWVIAIGNPFGLENSVTVGVLSAKERQVPNPDGIALQGMLQTDASINPGNSGGALVDLNGKLIGMPTAVIPYAQGIGFAVSIDVAKQIADRLIQTGKVPWLGIEHKSVTPEEAKRYGVPSGKGTVVFGVYPNGPAAQAGLMPGDLIVRVAGQAIADEKGLGNAIRAHNAGDRIEIIVVRKGKEMTLTATLGAVPPNLGRR